MYLFRIADSTELNNAWIVGVLAVCALAATWLVIALSIFVIRQAGRVLRTQALRSFIDGYARRARLIAVNASFAIAIAAAAVLAYALLRHEDLQPRVDQVLAQITDDTLITLARSAGVVIVFFVAFYVLQVGSRRLIERVRGWLSPRRSRIARAGREPCKGDGRHAESRRSCERANSGLTDEQPGHPVR